MLENILASIEQFVTTTPPDDLAAYVLLVVAPFVFLGVFVWGFAELWLDRKQGQYAAALKWDLLAINVPQDAIQTPKGMENFFNNIAGSKSAITWKEKWLLGKFQAYFSFEIVSNGGRVQFYIRTIKKYRDLVEAALYAQYPEAQITAVDDYVGMAPTEYPNEQYDLWGSEMVLGSPQYFPIKTYLTFEHMGEKDLRFKDPILPMIEMFGKMQSEEHYWLQILIMGPNSQDWTKEGQKYIDELYGKVEKKKSSLFAETIGWLPAGVISEITGSAASSDAAQADDFRMFKITPSEREQLDLVAHKMTQIGWWSKIRFVYWSKKDQFRKGTIASMTKGIFNQYALLHSNKLGLHDYSTPKDDYFFMEWAMPGKQRRLLSRFKKRSFSAGSTAYILTSEELATLFHFPPADARTPVLTSLGARRAEAPMELQTAPENMQVLMNVDRDALDVRSAQMDSENESLSVPTPRAPIAASMPKEETIWKDTSTESPEEKFMPKPGMPAPLPPGLDIESDAEDTTGSPDNLPI